MSNKIIVKEMLKREVNAVNNLEKSLDFNIVTEASEKIAKCKGNVIFAGCGSSSTAAFRAANIYNFLYIPSIAINVMNGLHGEYGIIRENDIFIPISKSGNTKEIIHSIPIAKKLGAYIIGITENKDSYIAKNSDICITFDSLREVDDKDMVASSSTTCTSIVLDIIGATVMKINNITDKDFKLIHPYGAVGEMLKN